MLLDRRGGCMTLFAHISPEHTGQHAVLLMILLTTVLFGAYKAFEIYKGGK